MIVLDFDGVVLESNDAKTEAFRDVFARFPEHVDAMMAFHRAQPWASRYVKFDYLLRELLGEEHNSTLREQLAQDFSRRTRERLATVPFVHGAETFLREFSRRVPLYVASVTPQADLDDTIRQRGLDGFFRDAYGFPPWTKVDAIRDVLRSEACQPGELVLVGDAPGDLRAAEDTGVEFVGRQSEMIFDPPLARTHIDLTAIADFLRPRLA